MPLSGAFLFGLTEDSNLCVVPESNKPKHAEELVLLAVAKPVGRRQACPVVVEQSETQTDPECASSPGGFAGASKYEKPLK